MRDEQSEINEREMREGQVDGQVCVWEMRLKRDECDDAPESFKLELNVTINKVRDDHR